MARMNLIGERRALVMPSERRPHERVPVGVYAAVFSEKGFHIGLVENISATGLFVADLPPFMPGNRLRLSLMVREDGAQIQATARVVRLDRQARLCGPNAAGLGLEFMAFEDDSQALLAAYIADCQNKPRKTPPRRANA